MRRLSTAGFKQPFARAAILPDWWDDSCKEQASLLSDIEIRVARFLGMPLSAVREPNAQLSVPAYAGARMRKVRDIDRDRLAPAIHAALRIASAVVRALRDKDASVRNVTSDPLEWRAQFGESTGQAMLNSMLSDLWSRGIPVIPVEVLPSPSFQGVSCVVEGRPAVLLGHRFDEPGRVAYHIAHEVGHVAAGDCTPDQPVVDDELDSRDDSDLEHNADRFAALAAAGTEDIPEVDGSGFKQLANAAAALEKETGVDAGLMIHRWAVRTGDFPQATMAVKALYRGTGARQALRRHFDQHIDIAEASDSDRGLLRCVFGGPENDGSRG